VTPAQVEAERRYPDDMTLGYGTPYVEGVRESDIREHQQDAFVAGAAWQREQGHVAEEGARVGRATRTPTRPSMEERMTAQRKTTSRHEHVDALGNVYRLELATENGLYLADGDELARSIYLGLMRALFADRGDKDPLELLCDHEWHSGEIEAYINPTEES
jgi:hypothetical protein